MRRPLLTLSSSPPRVRRRRPNTSSSSSSPASIAAALAKATTTLMLALMLLERPILAAAGQRDGNRRALVAVATASSLGRRGDQQPQHPPRPPPSARRGLSCFLGPFTAGGSRVGGSSRGFGSWTRPPVAGSGSARLLQQQLQHQPRPDLIRGRASSLQRVAAERGARRKTTGAGGGGGGCGGKGGFGVVVLGLVAQEVWVVGAIDRSMPTDRCFIFTLHPSAISIDQSQFIITDGPSPAAMASPAIVLSAEERELFETLLCVVRA